MENLLRFDKVTDSLKVGTFLETMYFRSLDFFQNVGRRHLGFSKFRNVTVRKGEEGRSASLAKFRSDRLNHS